MGMEITERLFRHMAWANKEVFTELTKVPESALAFSSWNPEWTVGKIANHIVIAQGRFISRLEKIDPPTEEETPYTTAGMEELLKRVVAGDAKFAKYLTGDDEMLHFVRMGEKVSFLKSTLLAQIPHHATDHRSQISGILAANGMDVINLDSIDLWNYETFERNSK